MKEKSQLSDKFSGPSTLLYQSEALVISQGMNGPKIFAATPELDVPCKVDTLNFEQGEAEVEEYNIFGLAGAWITDSEPGSIDLSFRVPSIFEDILALAFGEDAVSMISSGEVGEDGYEGLALNLKNKKVQGTWFIINRTKDRIMIINNTALFASIVLDSDARGVIAVDFKGSIEADETNPDVIFLKKKTAHLVVGYESYENVDNNLVGIGEEMEVVEDGMNVIEMV